MKKRIHIIHHTHWDMEWYFTSHDTNALLNYSLKNIMSNLKNKDEVFLFDGQVAPFEEMPKNPQMFNEFKKLVKDNKLKIGPWYSQPDLRLTSDEGIFRNFHYGQNIADLKTNTYSYLYTPDTFGFGENIPAIYNTINKKYAILWRGVNRDELNNEPIFKWKSDNGQSTIVYNIASGYFVGRYLYADKSLDTLYKNNILPSIKYQTANGKYSVAAIPSGGDQQPYNENLTDAIKKLNDKNDGNHYLLSSWEDFFKELEPQIKDISSYQGSHVHAYGGRIHKLVGSHRADIKKLLYKNEMQISRVLEPFILMTQIGLKMYPELEMDKMWKNILLSQAHDAYASCNSDIVNRNVKNRLLDSKNIYLSNKDLLIRFISNNYKDDTILVFNPTQYKGEKLFELEVATNSKYFEIKDKDKNVDYIIKSQKVSPGGVKVTYTANGEVEKKLPNFYISNIQLKTNVSKTSIKEMKCIELKKNKLISNENKNFVKFLNNKFLISDGKNKTEMDINFHLDGGDSYDLDLYDNVMPLTLANAINIKQHKKIYSKNIKKIKYTFELEVPKNMDGWLKNIKEETLHGELIFTLSNRIKVEYKFDNLQQSMLIQPVFNKKHEKNTHTVLTQNGYINRKNRMIVKDQEISKLREKPSDFDLMHGNVIIGDKDMLSIYSLDVREYKINNNQIFFNLIRTPDVLGRSDLKIRPGRKSGLSDKTVYIPDSTSELNNETFELTLGFNLLEHELSHVVDEMVIDDLAIHKQSLYKYYSNVNGWTLPNVQTSKKLENKIIISNSKIVLLAFFKSKEKYFIRINNPTNKILETSLKVFDKTYKNIKIKSNETKQIQFK